jgi:uncharacterized protein
MKKQHDKIKQLQLRAAPVTYSGSYVDAQGVLHSMDLKIRADDDNNRIIKGYLQVWGFRDTYGTVFVKGSCARSIRERGPESNSKQKIAHLWMHDPCNPTGRFTVLKEDDYGLYFEAELDEIPIGDRELTQVRSGTLNQFSVGFNYIWDKVEYDEETDSIMLLEVEMMEGSVVTFGSTSETHAIRSEELVSEKEILMEETDEFVRTLPRSRQLELRQLIKRHITLAAIKTDIDPIEKRKVEEGVLKVGDFKINTKEFKTL